MIEVVVYLKSLNKLRYKVATMKNAREFARNNILYGAMYIEEHDGQKHEIYYPPSEIFKIKILNIQNQTDDSITEKSSLTSHDN